MLKTIDGVSRAAVLDGYSSKSVQLPDFVRYNLIYGWNASGKTTLSRVVGLLCAGGPSRLPEGAYARFGLEGGGQLDTRKKDDCGKFHVRVFNRDFIEDNLSDQHTSAPALFIVGSENIRLSNRIAQLNGRRATGLPTSIGAPRRPMKRQTRSSTRRPLVWRPHVVLRWVFELFAILT